MVVLKLGLVLHVKEKGAARTKEQGARVSEERLEGRDVALVNFDRALCADHSFEQALFKN